MQVDEHDRTAGGGEPKRKPSGTRKNPREPPTTTSARSLAERRVQLTGAGAGLARIGSLVILVRLNTMRHTAAPQTGQRRTARTPKDRSPHKRTNRYTGRQANSTASHRVGGIRCKDFVEKCAP